ncbi:MAG: bifunctional 4-hydroxy-3-methylbut-2-enyl diphosphate reductase/30S ribosomal protein S1 [Eubacteriales bacterium]
MKVEIAKYAGFCYGVERAVKLAQQTAQTHDNPVMLGPVIHNSDVIHWLEEQGMNMVDHPDQVQKGQTVVIRSHGEGESIHTQLEARGANIVNATCPNVTKIHNIVTQGEREGKQVVIVGTPDHPEVCAIVGWCKNAVVVEDWKILEKYLTICEQNPLKPFVFVSQTTSTQKIWNDCVEIAKKVCTNADFFDTICCATFQRQREAIAQARKFDAMVVIGDTKSSNTKRLAELCSEHCANVQWIQSSRQLSPLVRAETVGITAGASTPQWIIKEVYKNMSENIMEIEESFAEMLEKSIKTLNTGDKVTGTVMSITQSEVQVDLGTKHAAYIPVSELSSDPSARPEDIVTVGEEVETYVVRVNDSEGMITLSKRRLDAVKGWELIEAAREAEDVLEGIVTEENKGGVVATVLGVRVFIPASQTGLPRETPMSQILKQKVSLVITEVNRAKRRVVGSISRVGRAARAEAAQKIWETIAEGNRYEGEVKSLTTYGAFVDIGGVDGMVHISELSWSRIKHPSEVVQIGDKVNVFVISADNEKKKISLGMKDRAQDPWSVFTGKFQIGDVATVRIVKLMTFGAFAEIVPGVDGLIHISQMADHRVEKPADVVSEGDTVDVQITDIDTDRKKVSLSMCINNEDSQDYINETE